MEKNTRKFMKELWSLLLSAQKNISGVPQQFLAAKEEEAKKKKDEADRISREIQQKREKENRESEREIKRKLGDENDDSRVVNHASDASSKYLLPNASNAHIKDNEVGRHKLRGQERFTKSPVEDRSPSLHRFRKSPVEDRSPSLHRNSSPSSRPRRKSFSNTKSSSRSRSSERFRSRSISKSPRRQRRSPLVEKRSHSPIRSSRYRRSPQNIRSPSRRRSPYLRWRSPSPIRQRSPTPGQGRGRSLSPQYRKSPSFVRKRSPSPRWRSPHVRRRLPSPSRHRSPSPPRRRSPGYHRRSPAPSYRSRDVKVSPYKRSRSRSPYPSQSPPHGGHTLRSLSKEPGKRDHASDRYQHEDEGHRPRGRRSPDIHSLEGEDKHSGGGRKAESSAQPLSTSLRSPQRDVMPQREEPYCGQYKSPVYARKTNVNEDGSEQDQHGTRRPHVERQEIGDASKKANQHSHKFHDGSESLQATEFREHSPSALGANSIPGSEDHLELSKSIKRSHSPRRFDGFPQDDYPNKPSRLSSHISEDIEYGPGRPEGDASQDHALVRQSSLRRRTRDDLSIEKASNGANMTSKREHRTQKIDDDDYSLDYKRAVVKSSIKNVEHTRLVDTYESDEENESCRRHSSDSKKQKKERIERKRKCHDDSDALSQDDERKEAKKRRKEEKKMQKEEKRRRHEERHRRREEQRAIKMKGRSDDADSREESHKNGDISDGDEGHEIFHRSDAEEPELAQRNLEIELRKKALESLRAKKAISH